MNDSLRVLIALDPGAPNNDAFAALGALTRGFQVDVRGLFVEDDNLVRFATLPVAQEVRLSSGTLEQVSVTDLSNQMRARAQRVRTTFEVGVRTLRVPHSFTVCRGEVLAELRREAATCDLLMIARSLRSSPLRSWLGITITQLLTQPPSSLLFVQEPWASGRSVVVAASGAHERDEQAHQLAQMLARAEGLDVHSLDGSHGRGGAASLPEDLDNRALLAVCQHLHARVLVLIDTPALRRQVDLESLLRNISASVVLLQDETK